MQACHRCSDFEEWGPLNLQLKCHEMILITVNLIIFRDLLLLSVSENTFTKCWSLWYQSQKLAKVRLLLHFCWSLRMFKSLKILMTLNNDWGKYKVCYTVIIQSVLRQLVVSIKWGEVWATEKMMTDDAQWILRSVLIMWLCLFLKLR